MAPRLPGLVEALRRRRAVTEWRRAAASVEAMSAPDLAALRPQARALAEAAGRLSAQADRVLLRPRIGRDGIDRPPQCDWAWRPLPWAARLVPAAMAGVAGGTALAEGVTLFHDCPLAEITLRQVRRRDPDASAPFALSLDALEFDGTFLSLALDLPREGATSLRRTHVVRISARVRRERPAEMFVRLNIRQGPNTEQMVSELIPGDRPDAPVEAEFDLGFQDINPDKLEHAWLDLIFERPAMNRVTVEDLTLTRRPRAEI